MRFPFGVPFGPCRHRGGPKDSAETNHERTLSVPYVFRNHLIWREQVEGPAKAALNGSLAGGAHRSASRVPRRRGENQLGRARAAGTFARDLKPPVLRGARWNSCRSFGAVIRVRKIPVAAAAAGDGLVGSLMLLSQGSAVAPFVYTLFWKRDSRPRHLGAFTTARCHRGRRAHRCRSPPEERFTPEEACALSRQRHRLIVSVSPRHGCRLARTRQRRRPKNDQDRHDTAIVLSDVERRAAGNLLPIKHFSL